MRQILLCQQRRSKNETEPYRDATHHRARLSYDALAEEAEMRAREKGLSRDSSAMAFDDREEIGTAEKTEDKAEVPRLRMTDVLRATFDVKSVELPSLVIAVFTQCFHARDDAAAGVALLYSLFAGPLVRRSGYSHWQPLGAPWCYFVIGLLVKAYFSFGKADGGSERSYSWTN